MPFSQYSQLIIIKEAAGKIYYNIFDPIVMAVQKGACNEIS